MVKLNESILKKMNIPQTVLVLGSGWNKVIEEMEVEAEIGFEEWLGVKASVPGHEGRLLVGKLQKTNSKNQKGIRVAVMAGRIHMYEGYSAREATAPIRALAAAGMKKLVLTAACGALNEKYRVGDFLITSDILTLFLALDNPLRGPEFVDMSEVFNPDMRKVARQVCVDNDIHFHEGVYAYYHGPNYETPVDKMALKFLGADVCGMSTVPEAIVARSLGVEVLSLGFVTNLAFVRHDHKEVVAEANKASEKMGRLLKGIVGGI